MQIIVLKGGPLEKPFEAKPGQVCNVIVEGDGHGKGLLTTIDVEVPLTLTQYAIVSIGGVRHVLVGPDGLTQLVHDLFIDPLTPGVNDVLDHATVEATVGPTSL